jgi:hypothetical protein
MTAWPVWHRWHHRNALLGIPNKSDIHGQEEAEKIV